MSKPANHKRIQRYKPLESRQQLGENTSSCQVMHKFGMSLFSTRGRNRKTLPTYETVTGMVERLNFVFLVFVSFSCVFEMSRCVTHRYDRNGKDFVDPVPNVYAGTCKSRIA